MRFLLLTLALAAACASETKDPARLRVAVWSGDTPIRERATLKSGAEINLAVEPVPACHVYVIHRGPGDEFNVLFPESGASSQLEGARTVLEGNLDEKTGLESLHVIASREPLSELEQAIRSGAKSAIIAAVSEVRQRYEKVTVVAARPAPIGGLVRSPPEALEYTFADVLCRTYAVDHR